MPDFDRVRVRVAPSPTGDPHVGLAYITLFNYAFAKKMGGDFIVRIEDTDQTRAKSSSDAMIMQSLKWLGFQWSEGPDCGGPYGPYRQSERTEIYQNHAQILVDKGHAYPCYCTAERLEAMRATQRQEGQMPRYDGHCRNLSEADRKHHEGQSFVIRLKMPTTGTIAFQDYLRGPIEINSTQLDDQVLIKSDGYPTYHLANVVDDHLMKISHVIRAEEWISSTPKHVILYEAFGWTKPTFVHMPLLRNHDRSKISKRKNPTSINFYQRKGILPHAMLNFLALMGWSYGDNKEIFTLDEMIQAFDLKDISLGGPVFDLVKLTAINQHYIQELTPDEFVDYMQKQVFSPEYLKALYPHVIKRLDTFEQFVDKNSFFFNGALDYQTNFILPKNRDLPQIKEMVSSLVEKLDDLYEWDTAHLHHVMDEHRNAIGWKPQDYFMSVRLIVTGRKDSPPLAESMELVGREMVRFRLRDFLQFSPKMLS